MISDESVDISDFNSYYTQVAKEATKLGYNSSQIKIFYHDICDYFDDNKSVEECINEVF